MDTNGKTFVTNEEIQPVKVSIGSEELYVYNSTTAEAVKIVQEAFGFTPKRTYKKRAKTAAGNGAHWGEDAPRKPRKTKTDKELVAA